MLHASLPDVVSDVTNRAKWRWECLRRNEEYRHDYQAFAASDCVAWFTFKFQKPLSGFTGVAQFLEVTLRSRFEENWSDTDYKKAEELSSFQMACVIKWGCNWFCDPNAAPFQGIEPFEPTRANVINHFSSLPLVLPRFTPFACQETIGDWAKKCGQFIDEVGKIKPLREWIDSNMARIYALPAVCDIPTELRHASWPRHSRVVSEPSKDSVQLKLHPSTDPAEISNFALTFGVLMGFLNLEFARYQLPKTFEGEIDLPVELKTLAGPFNQQRKKFPFYLPLAFDCYRLKEDVSGNGTPPTDSQIAERLSHTRMEAMDPNSVKRYRSRIQKLILNGCPW